MLGTYGGQTIRVRVISGCLYVTFHGVGGSPVNVDWLRGVVNTNGWAAGVTPFAMSVVDACFKSEGEPCGPQRVRATAVSGGGEVSDLTLVPNPATETVELRLPEGERIKTVTCHDLRGSVLLRGSQPKLSVGTLTPGSYLIQVESQSGKRYQKLLIKQ